MNITRLLKIAIYTRNGRFKRLDERVAELLAPTFNTSYELIVSVDGEIGRHLENGYWTGVAGMVLRGEVDLAASLTPTEERYEIIDFSYPYILDQVTFISGKSETLNSKWAFFYPLSNEVWIILVMSIVVISIMLYIFLRRKHKFLFIALNVIGVILRQSYLLKTDTFAESALCIFWIIGTMFLANFYTNVLLSFLTFPPIYVINDITELSKVVARGTHQCVTYPGSHLPSSFVTYGDDRIRLIGENLKNHKGSFSPLEVLEAEDNGLIFIQLRSSFLILKDMYFVSHDAFQEIPISVAYAKNFCCRKPLEVAIHRATAAGLFEKLQQDSYYLQYLPELLKAKVPENVKTISLADLTGAFLLMIFSYVFACFVLVLEILSNKIHCFRYKRKKVHKHVITIRSKYT